MQNNTTEKWFSNIDKDGMLQKLGEKYLIDAVIPKRRYGDRLETRHHVPTYHRKLFCIGRTSAPQMLLHAPMTATELSNLRTHQLRTHAATVTHLKS